MAKQHIFLLFTLYALQLNAQELPDPAKTSQASLEQLLAYAEVHAPALAIVSAQAKQGEAAIEAAKPKYPENPTLGLVLGPRQGQGEISFDIEVSFSQKFEIYGERALRQKAASKASEVYLAQRDIVAWEVSTQVRAAFWLALLAKQQVEAAERFLAFTESTLEISKKLQKAGDVSALSVRLAEGDILLGKQAKRAAESEYKKSCINLAAAAGWPLTTPLEPKGTLETPRKAASLSVLLPLALQKQPFFAKNKAEASAAEAMIELQEREAKPELILGASLAQESIGNASETLLVATFGVSLPTSQKNQGARAKARADLAITLTEAEAQKLSIEAELARKIEDVNSAVDSIAAYNTEILPALETNLTLLQKTFTLGEIDILQIGTARERFLQLQRSALSDYADYYLAVAALELVLGAELVFSQPSIPPSTQPAKP